MQHYGFPTELMDATTSLDTAAFFSRFEAGGMVEGAFAVFDVSVLLSGNGTVIDLCDHPTALRAIRQEAYGVFHRRHSDLKDPQAVSDMGITWYTFLSDPLEASESDSNRSCNARCLILLKKAPARSDHAAARRRDISLTLAI